MHTATSLSFAALACLASFGIGSLIGGDNAGHRSVVSAPLPGAHIERKCANDSGGKATEAFAESGQRATAGPASWRVAGVDQRDVLPVPDSGVASTRFIDGAAVETLASSLLNENQPLSRTLDALDRGDAGVAERILRALAVVGSPEAKSRLVKVLFDEEESDALRGKLIDAMDWRSHATDLVRLIRAAKSDFVQTAAINAAQQGEFRDDESRMLEAALIDHYYDVPDDRSRIAIVDYFSNRNPRELGRLTEPGRVDDLSDAVIDHIDFVSTPSTLDDVGGAPSPGG